VALHFWVVLDRCLVCHLYAGVKLPSKRQHRTGHNEPDTTKEERKTGEVASPVAMVAAAY